MKFCCDEMNFSFLYPWKSSIFSGLVFPEFSLSIFFFCSNYSLLNEISSLFQCVKVIECVVHNCTKFFPSFLKSGLWLAMWSRLKEDIIIWDVFICLRIWMSTRITCCELKMKMNMYVIYPMLFQIPSISHMVNEVLSGCFCCVCVGVV